MSATNTPGGDPDHGPRRELTVLSVVLGLILSVVMGAANVYLGLRAGMTVSASIPAAVIAMAILHGVLGRRSILESNMVQTAASAGESLAAGIIFTMPALILVGVWKEFDFWTTSMIALAGGLLGVVFMIPMRRVFVVESEELKFPEGLACAEVLRAGEGEEEDEGGGLSGAVLVFLGLGVGAVFKFCASYLGLLKEAVEWATIRGTRTFYFGADVLPALVGVGVIVGLSISVQIFLGGAIGALISLPLLDASSTMSGIAATAASEGAHLSHLDLALQTFGQLRADQIRYMGVGAMLVGGILSIWQVRHGLVHAMREMFAHFAPTTRVADIPKTERNIGGAAILLTSFAAIAAIAGVYYSLLHHLVGITLLTTAIMVVMSFFFTAVASYIVGLVGSSNSPVSGMTISAVLATGALLFAFGFTGESAILATLGVAGVVCCVACTSGDVCNDLKTGYLVGASPRHQQMLQIAGVAVAAFIMAPVMTALHQGSLNEGRGGIGVDRGLSAPQSALFASLADGFFGEGELPWDMVEWGVGVGVALVIADQLLRVSGAGLRLHVMPVAVGLYLPFSLTVPILLGGLISYALGRRKDNSMRRAVLLTSGLIAGESLVGVAIGFLKYMEFASPELLAGAAPWVGNALSLGAMAVLCVWIYWQSTVARSQAG